MEDHLTDFLNLPDAKVVIRKLDEPSDYGQYLFSLRATIDGKDMIQAIHTDSPLSSLGKINFLAENMLAKVPATA